MDQLGVPGFTLYVEAARAAGLVSGLERAGAVRVDQAAVTAARVEAAVTTLRLSMTNGFGSASSASFSNVVRHRRDT